MRLTGRFEFRRTLTGKIVLQVEEEVKSVWPMSRTRPYVRRWRNARIMDLTTTELRPLMDLRVRSPLLGLEMPAASTPAPQPPVEAPANVFPLAARQEAAV